MIKIRKSLIDIDNILNDISRKGGGGTATHNLTIQIKISHGFYVLPNPPPKNSLLDHHLSIIIHVFLLSINILWIYNISKINKI